MRLVCYLGTRGCPGVLEDALRGHFDPVLVAVPVEPRLAGSHLSGPQVREGFADVAELLARRAGERALAIARRGEEELAGVFERTGDPAERIDVEVLEPPIDRTLPDRAGELDTPTCFLARDALDVLADADVDLATALEARGIELVTR